MEWEGPRLRCECVRVRAVGVLLERVELPTRRPMRPTRISHTTPSTFTALAPRVRMRFGRVHLHSSDLRTLNDRRLHTRITPKSQVGTEAYPIALAMFASIQVPLRGRPPLREQVLHIDNGHCLMRVCLQKI